MNTSIAAEPMTCTVQMAEAWCKNNFISYKNILQEYCQKKFLPVPNYKSENTPHGLRGTVSFGSEMMKSEVLMPSPKEADQRVAFEALKNIGVLPADAVFNERCPVELPSKKRKSESPNVPHFSPKIQFIESSNIVSMKSRLQEIAQKSKLNMPEYQVSGSHQNFMATVAFNGHVFSSNRTFSKKKLAEQDAAHTALYKLGYVSNPPNGLVINNQIMSSTDEKSTDAKAPSDNYKNKLQEFMQSKKCSLPKYETTKQNINGSSGYVATVVVEGREHRSSFKKTKKEAEKEAAFNALLAIGILT